MSEDLPTVEDDPFDPAKLAIDVGCQEFDPNEPPKVIPCRKPGRQEWFRSQPGVAIPCGLLKDEADSVLYLVTPRIYDALDDEAKPFRLHLCVNRQGGYFLFPVQQRGEDARDNDWVTSAERALIKSKNSWTRMKSNMRAGEYKVAGLEDGVELSEPVWPDLEPREILRLAFADHLIDRMDHPLIRRLRGLA